jgi:hypothetical protein
VLHRLWQAVDVSRDYVEVLEMRKSMCLTIKKLLDSGKSGAQIAELYGYDNEKSVWSLMKWAKDENICNEFTHIEKTVDKKKCLIW